MKHTSHSEHEKRCKTRRGYRATNAIYQKTGIHKAIFIPLYKGKTIVGVRELQRYDTPAGALSFVQWKDDTLINASLRVFPRALKDRKHCLGIE